MMRSPRQLRSASHWGAFRVQVGNGVIETVEPFEHDPSPSALLKNTVEMAYALNRVGKPSVRKGWLANDGGKNRGHDEFVDVGWDEALDLVAGQLRHIRNQHGPQSILGGSYGWSSAGRVHHARNLLHRFLAAGGGFTAQQTNYSFGAAMAFLPHIVGKSESMGRPVTPVEQIVENAEIVVAFGGMPKKNWEIQSGGSGIHALRGHLEAFARQGTKVVTVSPFRGDEPEIPKSEYIAIKPNTDTALILALVHVLLANDLQDKKFIATYTSGFEAFADYVLGKSDGVAKTPGWASAIAGVPARTIETLARTLAGKRSMLTATWSLQRAVNGEQPFWALIALAAALGRIGLPGQGYGFGYGSMNGMGDAGYRTPISGIPELPNPATSHIPCARVTDLLLMPGQSYRYNFETRVYPEIQLVYWAGGNPFHHHQDLRRLSAAFKRPAFVVVNEIAWNGTARHADVVLPATTTLERNDLGGSSRDPFILAMHKAIDPVGSARNDYDIFTDLGRRLGYEHVFTGGRTGDDWVRARWDYSRELLAERGIDAPDFDEFWEQGYFRLPEPDVVRPQFDAFRSDPVAHPLETVSGRIMISLPQVADEGLPPHPAWLAPGEFLGDRLAERFPLHLLTPQPAGRLHSQSGLSAASQSYRKDGYEVVRLNPADARERSIESGDVVQLFNDRGSCLAVASLDGGVREKVAIMPTGADFYAEAARGDSEVMKYDRGSNPNTLTKDIGTSVLGQGCAAQSCLIDIRLRQRELPNGAGLDAAKARVDTLKSA